jgi:hypothetical protein
VFSHEVGGTRQADPAFREALWAQRGDSELYIKSTDQIVEVAQRHREAMAVSSEIARP